METLLSNLTHEKVNDMLIFDPSERIPSAADIEAATEMASDQLTIPAGEGQWDDTQGILRGNPSWSYRLDHPKPERVIELSQLFKEGSRYEKYYWQGISNILGLDDEIVRCFPTRIIAEPYEYDVELSQALQSIVTRLSSKASDYPQGQMVYDELITNFTTSFGDFLVAVAAIGGN